MRIEPLGDSALLVRVVESFDAEESLDAVLRATRQLELAKIPGVIELARRFSHAVCPRTTNWYGCVTLHSYHFYI